MKNEYVYVDTTTIPIQYHKIQFELIPDDASEIELYSKDAGHPQYVDIYSKEMEITSIYIMKYADRL